MELRLKTGSEGSLASARDKEVTTTDEKVFFALLGPLGDFLWRRHIFRFPSKIILIFVREPSLLDERKFSLSHPYWDIRVKSHSRNKMFSESLKITSNVGPWDWAVNKTNEWMNEWMKKSIETCHAPTLGQIKQDLQEWRAWGGK